METKKSITLETKKCRLVSPTGHCPKPLESASSFLSKKWTISIIIVIGNFSSLRFNDLRQKLEHITAKTLSDRLQELEKEQVVSRKSFHEIPPRVEYSLTSKGKKLMKALLPLIRWAQPRRS